jgi:hypothetical protein
MHNKVGGKIFIFPPTLFNTYNNITTFLSAEFSFNIHLPAGDLSLAYTASMPSGKLFS